MTIERIILNDLEQIKNLQPKGWSDIIPDIKFYIEIKKLNQEQLRRQ